LSDVHLHQYELQEFSMDHTIRSNQLNDPVERYLRRDFTTLSPDQTVAEALESLRSKHLSEEIIYFYVTDDDGRLFGVVPTRRLLMSPTQETISSIMVRNMVTIPHSATVADACEFFVLHRFLAFPVVDEDKRLLGVIDVNLFTEGVFDIAETHSFDSIFQLIGVHAARGRRESSWSSFRRRFPWLTANIAGGLLCAAVAALYQDLLEVLVILSLFIPIVLALAESVSIQSMTLTLQSFQDRFHWPTFGKAMGREFLTASLLGIFSGAIVAAVIWGWKGETLVSIAVWGSIFLSMVTACLLGVLLPTVIHAFKGDPKIAAGPIVLALTDTATLIFYFNIAGILLTNFT
jgi:magnesium transporter